MLTEDQVSFYRDNGYLLVKGMLDPDEAKALREECHDLAHRLARNGVVDPTWG